MLLLQQTFPLLFYIVSIVEGDQLPEALTAFIIDLLEKEKSPFNRNGSIPDAVQLDVHRTNDVEYYPCLPVVRSRGDYCLDDTTPNICAKRSTRHPSLLPGVFLVHCKHGTIMLWVCIIILLMSTMTNITSDIKNVNLSSLWPPTSYCYPLYIPDYPVKLQVYALLVVLVIRFRFFSTNVIFLKDQNCL